MDYKLDKDRNLQENIYVLFDTEISGCITSLKELDVHSAIHDIRKRMKKLRALVRLFRDEMGEEKYKSFNIRFRDLGREISEIRDLTAHLEILEKLKERYGKYLYKNFFSNVQKKLETERNDLTEELQEKDFFESYLLQELEKIKEEISLETVKPKDIRSILPGIKRVYSRGRKAMDKAYKYKSPENFHEWRKRVKYLWYQILLLWDSWPILFESLEAEVHLLADHLGDDHDLMIFKGKILSDAFGLKDPEQKGMYEVLIAEYSDSLRKDAKTKGELIYAESPKDFRKRIGKYTQINWN